MATLKTYGIAVNNSAFDTETDPQLYETDIPFTVGCLDADSSNSAVGIIDEILVMHRLPTTQERAYLYNSGSGRTLYS